MHLIYCNESDCLNFFFPLLANIKLDTNQHSLFTVKNHGLLFLDVIEVTKIVLINKKREYEI